MGGHSDNIFVEGTPHGVRGIMRQNAQHEMVQTKGLIFPFSVRWRGCAGKGEKGESGPNDIFSISSKVGKEQTAHSKKMERPYGKLNSTIHFRARGKLVRSDQAASRLVLP